MSVFTLAVADAVSRIGPIHLRTLADAIAGSHPLMSIADAVPLKDLTDVTRTVLAAQTADGVPKIDAAAYIRGVADGFAQHANRSSVEIVWSGPSSHAVPVRVTAAVLTDLVSEATHELLLMTYSAKPYAPLIKALRAALDRNVIVSIVVETLQGAGSALSGTEPAAAFSSMPDIQLFHWPTEKRAQSGAKQHAKVAVSDRRSLLVSSANLTQSGVDKNIEAGVLVRGGTAPVRAAEHIVALRSSGVLTRLN